MVAVRKVATSLLLLAYGVTKAASSKPVAVVYEGPAACDTCAEAVRAAIQSKYKVVFAGPSADSVRKALKGPGVQVYIQPGGGDDMTVGWNAVKNFAQDIRDFVKRGGNYVGICMGGFLAGTGPGYKLLGTSDSQDYIQMPGAIVKDMSDFLMPVVWKGKRKHIYFQGGPAFTMGKGVKGHVVATYTNKAIAAMVVPYGKGAVGVTGPHPEAPQSWYDAWDGAKEVTSLMVQLVDETVKFGGRRLEEQGPAEAQEVLLP